MINNVTMVGRLTQDPELRYTPAGKAVCTGTLAVGRPFKNQAGDNEADFINFVIWGKPAENTSNFVKKGGILGIVGRWQTRNYENSEGKRVYVNELVAESVQFIGGKPSNTGNNGGNTAPLPTEPPAGSMDITDDDLPF